MIAVSNRFDSSQLKNISFKQFRLGIEFLVETCAGPTYIMFIRSFECSFQARETQSSVTIRFLSFLKLFYFLCCYIVFSSYV